MQHNHDFTPVDRGFSCNYHPGEANRCPGCGRSNWIVGRISAECAFCATALPIRSEISTGALATVFQSRFSEPAARGRYTINGKTG